MVVTVPPIREHLGYKRADMVPATYPRALTVSSVGDLIQCQASSKTTTETGTWLRRSLRRAIISMELA
jgi:hypothetical protein